MFGIRFLLYFLYIFLPLKIVTTTKLYIMVSKLIFIPINSYLLIIGFERERERVKLLRMK